MRGRHTQPPSGKEVEKSEFLESTKSWEGGGLSPGGVEAASPGAYDVLKTSPCHDLGCPLTKPWLGLPQFLAQHKCHPLEHSLPAAACLQPLAKLKS